MLTPTRTHELGPASPVEPRKSQGPGAGTPRPPSRRYGEARTQREIVAYLRARGELVMRLENAARRTPAQIARDKALGLLPGAPDLIVPRLRLAIEVKSSTGKVSPAQREVHEALQRCGWTVVVARGLPDLLPHLR